MATLQEIIANEWHSRAPELAEWAMNNLVNRHDVWGQYSVPTPAQRRKDPHAYKAVTLPAKDSRDESATMVTLDKLTRHFASRRHRKPQLIGLHAKSQTATSRWFGVDIDNHAADANQDDDVARRNLNAAVNWYAQLQDQGYDPLLIDSNGAGGYHLWVLFAEAAPTEHVHAMAMALTADWQKQELAKQPEVFPKTLKQESLGSWFRLPGLHHTRDHHARIWSGEEHLGEPWLAGHAAIDAILAVVPGPPPPAVDTDALATVPTRQRPITDAQPGDQIPVLPSRPRKRQKRARVCVDLDGVLAHRTGNASIGPPIDGAVEFTRELHQSCEIIIFTARFSTRSGKARSHNAVQALHGRLERWLEKHRFAWDTINTSTAKPIAVAYIDDRGVVCRPTDQGLKAYQHALKHTLQLVDND